jgi:predicted heme/steroid binding protein
MLREFTPQELAHFNGEGDGPIYVACRGKVYDVSESTYWNGGLHQATHFAGLDLTAEITEAPHGMEMLEKYPIVGRLIK